MDGLVCSCAIRWAVTIYSPLTQIVDDEVTEPKVVFCPFCGGKVQDSLATENATWVYPVRAVEEALKRAAQEDS